MSRYIPTGNGRGSPGGKYTEPLVRGNMVLRPDQMEYLIQTAKQEQSNIQAVLRHIIDRHIKELNGNTNTIDNRHSDNR